MQTNILDAISNQYSTLPRSGRKLADYIFTHKSETQYLSITSLAEASKVSEATITRFCKLLGLAGYNDLKLALAKAEQPPAAGYAETAPTGAGALTSLCHQLYHADVTALTETLSLVSETQIQAAAALLSKARRIYCFGQGSSNVMAKEAWALFSTASASFIHIEDSHMQSMASSLCAKEDVILFFSYSGATRDMLDVLKPARANGASIILVTHFANSPAAALADICLLFGPNESPLQSGSIAAKIGQLFIIDCLFHTYCQSSDSAVSARSATAQSTARKLL